MTHCFLSSDSFASPLAWGKSSKPPDTLDPPGDKMRNAYRSNPFGLPVIVAEGRSRRPHTARRHAAHTPPDDTNPSHDKNCPFCPGNEDQTPPEIAAHAKEDQKDRAPNTPGWTARVIPNLYPALTPDTSTPDSSTPDTSTPDILSSSKILPCNSQPARGLHEVSIHSPDHTGRLCTLSDHALANTVTIWQERLHAHRAEGWAATTLIVNEGKEAGASLAHPHAQLFATDVVPPAVQHEITLLQVWTAQHKGCLLEATVQAEQNGPRMIDREGSLVAWAPYWASVPYEVWIAPAPQHTTPSTANNTTHGAFADSPHITEFATLLARTTRRIETAANDPAINLVLRDPLHQTGEGAPWHVRILPRTSIAAGFELATGVRIVTISPETAAEHLREAL